jgi:hypothetical protein
MLSEILTNMPGVAFFQAIPGIILLHLLFSVLYTLYAYYFVLDRKIGRELLLVGMLALIPFGSIPLVVAHVYDFFKRGER